MKSVQVRDHVKYSGINAFVCYVDSRGWPIIIEFPMENIDGWPAEGNPVYKLKELPKYYNSNKYWAVSLSEIRLIPDPTPPPEPYCIF